jgi:hypothetical protein
MAREQSLRPFGQLPGSLDVASKKPMHFFELQKWIVSLLLVAHTRSPVWGALTSIVTDGSGHSSKLGR